MNPSEYIEQNFDTLLLRLSEWLAIPSISSLSIHSPDVRKAAEWIRTMMAGAGLADSRIIETDGHPLVYGSWQVDPTLPTLLLYGHYDVQPVDPLSKWKTPPFEPTILNGNIYARGASDDKGQTFLALAAIEAWAKACGKPPINLKVLLEGEEEAGGHSIADYVRNHPEELATDCVLICDTSMLSATSPSIITALRGILYTEIKVDGAITDLHSGSYGGVAPNPLHALCLLIQRLKDEDGRINIAELEAALPSVSEKELQFWQEDPIGLADTLQKEMGVTSLVGEEEYPPLQRLGHRPTLELHGISGGYTGEGAKTVIPATATAKLSMRLPGGLDPVQVFKWLERAVQQKLPVGYSMEITNLHSGGGVVMDAESPAIQAAVAALQDIYGKEPIFLREGGSIPIAALFAEILKAPLVLMGFGLPDDRIHAPNEKLSIQQLKNGMKTVALFLEKLVTKP